MKFIKRALITLSILLNAFLIYNALKFKLHLSTSAATPVFSNEFSNSVNVGGIVKFNDKKNQPTSMAQSWAIRISQEQDGKYSCSLLDLYQIGDHVLFNNSINECEIVNLSFEQKLAVIKYNQAIITINETGASFMTSDPQEKGGGILVNSYDM